MGNVNTNQPSPGQPTAAYYPTTALQLFPSYTRATFLAAFGYDAPTYDSTKKPKDWFDRTLQGQPTDTVTYNYVDTSVPGKPVIGTMSMSVAEAGAPNFPGVHSFPSYGIAPTTATEQLLGSPAQTINPATLSTSDQANQLAQAWNVPPTDINQWTPGGPITFDWGTETRRVYQILYNGFQLNVGQYVAMMYANGIGAPGSWNLTGPQPVWVSTLPAAAVPTLNPWPEPVRALLPNEALWSGLFGGCEVYRTDMVSPYNPALPSSGPTSTGPSGGLTAAQDARLTRIETDVAAIGKALGQTPA